MMKFHSFPGHGKYSCLLLGLSCHCQGYGSNGSKIILSGCKHEHGLCVKNVWILLCPVFFKSPVKAYQGDAARCPCHPLCSI